MHLLKCLCLIILTTRFSIVYADSNDCPDIKVQDDILFQLSMQYEAGCFGGDRDKAQISVNALSIIANLNQNETPTVPERISRFKQGAELLTTSLAIEARSEYAVKFNIKPLALLKQELEQAVTALDNLEPVSFLNPQHWKFDPNDGAIGDQFSLHQHIIEPGCPHECTAGITLSVNTLRHLKLMERYDRMLHGNNLVQFNQQVTRLNEQWRLYATAARSQTPLELAINSYFYQKKAVSGFAEPPSHQLIVLHPSLILEHVSNADRGSRLKPGLAVEWFGANWWRWSEGNKVSMLNPLGISVISTYSDRAGSQSIRHGLMFHYNHMYSLGVTHRGSDTGIFISVDLQKLLTDKNNAFTEVKRRFL